MTDPKAVKAGALTGTRGVWTCPLREGALRHPEAEALTFAGSAWTYRALDAEVGRWVRALEDRGVGAGDRVALLATNHVASVCLFWALGRLGASKAKSAKLTMVVDHRAAGRMVSMVLGPLSGMQVQQKRSFLDGKLGAKIGAPALHLSDEPLLERGLGSRHWDGEGMATRARPIFEAGVLRTYFIDTYYARKMGTKPTTGGASNLSWKLGSKDQAALLADVKEGILVTGFLGGNSNGATGDFSLGVQGFRIRRGQIAEPVSEMNIAGNQTDLWKRLAVVGNDPFPYSSMRTPTLVFDKVDFAGV